MITFNLTDPQREKTLFARVHAGGDCQILVNGDPHCFRDQAAAMASIVAQGYIWEVQTMGESENLGYLDAGIHHSAGTPILAYDVESRQYVPPQGYKGDINVEAYHNGYMSFLLER